MELRMSGFRVAVIFAAGLTLSSPALSRTWHILNDGSGDALTVQAGIDSASVGDTVLVGPGTYPEQVNFLGKNVVVLSSGGPSQTTLDGTGLSGRVVRFYSGESRSAVLEGFSITGGQGGIIIMDSEPSILGNWVIGNHSPEDGGGIGCVGNMQVPPSWHPLIKGNRIVDNVAENLGAGLALEWDIISEVTDNFVFNNETIRGDGGGIYFINDSTPGTVIRRNFVANNRAGDHGGGIYIAQIGDTGPSELEVSENVVWKNYAHGSAPITPNSGGGIWIWESNAWVHNNTIVENSGDGPDSSYGGGIAIEREGSPTIETNIIAFTLNGGGIWCGGGATPIIRNNLAWQNSGGEGVKDCPNWWQSNGNVIDNPYFCDMASGDFTVASNSGVMTHPAGPLGAFSTPGCGPVAVHPSTWGSLKARYH
jgi:hypothetical protein